MIQLRRPLTDTVQSPAGILNMLTAFYEAIVELRKPIVPSRVPVLQAITLPTFAKLRSTQGDAAGSSGPMSCIVSGQTTPFDSSRGVFIWDPTSVAADDNANTIAVSGVSTGRWRRLV